jgi:hypothetical protein
MLHSGFPFGKEEKKTNKVSPIFILLLDFDINLIKKSKRPVCFCVCALLLIFLFFITHEIGAVASNDRPAWPAACRKITSFSVKVEILLLSPEK